jgi:hypothetical protein
MGSPVAKWRRLLAHLVVGSHRLLMCMLYFIPLAVFFMLLAEEYPGAALLTGGLTAAAYVGSLWLAGKLLAVSPRPARRGSARRALLRLYRVFVGYGDAIQAISRRIDPDWQNPYTGSSPQETAYRLASGEVGHWALVGASVAPVAAAFWYGHYFLGFVCVAANVLYNVAPNLVSRDTRGRLLRLSWRTPAAGTNVDGSGRDAVAPVPEVLSVVVATGGPRDEHMKD